MSDDHYLKQELYELVRTDPSVFEFLESGSLDGLWFWDLDNPEAEWMSPRFWEVLGFDPAEKAHSPAEWQGLIHTEDLASAIANFQKHATDPADAFDQLLRYRHRDGSTVWVRCRALVLHGEDGAPRRMLGVHNEVTSLQGAEEVALRERLEQLERARRALERSNRLLKQSNEALTQFAYAASHDLQEPLRMVASFSALLGKRYEGELDERADRWLGHIVDGASRMQDLVAGLLEWSRVQTEGCRFEPVELGALVKEVEEDLSVVLAAAGARIEMVGTLPVVTGDSPQLRRVIQNLVENAVKFRQADVPPVIRIEAGQQTGLHLIAIADNGIGIPLEFHQRVFEVFQRLHPRDEVAGSGLGLAISQRIVERHGGELRVQSDGAGCGSTFTMMLPRL